MKTPTTPSKNVLQASRVSGFNVLTLTAALTASLFTANAADVQWQGGTSSYTNAANWNPATVPGATDSAINDSGLGNAVQINAGNPDWTVGQIRAGNSAGDGAFEQNGQTVTVLGTNYNGPVITEFFTPFRLGILAADTGVYTLNGGTLNYGNGQLSVGTDGTGIMNINGGSIAGSGNFAVNAGGITTPNPAVLTATAGHGLYMGDFTYFEKGYYTPDSSTGLPAPGTTVASVGDPSGHSFTLAPSYTAPNAVIVDAAVPNVTITLPTPTACSGLSFMCSCGDGPVHLNYTVNHSSGVAETGTLTVQDWFAGTNTINATNEVLATYARVDALGRNFQVTGHVNGMNGNPPYMWSVDVPVSNPNTVTSIGLTYVDGGSSYATATILGVSAQTGGSGPFAPLAINGYNYDVVVENGAPSPVVSPSITDVANQTNGILSISGELWVGNNGVGIYNLTNGTINASNWVNVGRYGGTGTFNMAGGAINKSGNAFTVGANAGNPTVGAVGTVNQSGGTINSSSEVWIGQANNSPSLGTGTYNISGTAALNVTNWLAVAREGGIGTLNITGGSIYRTGNGNVTITHGTGADGTVNQSGGSFTVASGQVWIGEDSGDANWTMTGGTANFGVVNIVENASATGTLNLNGGVMSLQELTTGNTGGYSTLTFDGGTLQATANNANFLHDLTEVDLNSGGVTIDSQGYTITIPQDLPTIGSGSGGLTKIGSGMLALTGANSYSGPTIVSEGILAVSTGATGGGDYQVADGADLAEEVLAANAQLNMANFTVGASTGAALDFNLGNFGNPTAAPINVNNTFAANGTITINITDTLPQLGQFPLIQYQSGGMTGSATFVLGSHPAGVTASIVNNTGNNSIDLDITAADLPRWDGQAGGNWDIGLTTNWVNIGTGLPSFYNDGAAVVFDDNAAGTTTVNLTTAVHPGNVTITNDSLNYSFVGTGNIAGSVGLKKQGSGTLSVLNTGGNSYTGPTVISGGKLSVTNLANGGSPSPIGASSADPANLVLAGGALTYSGAPVAVDRGYSIQGAVGTIDTEGNLALSGAVAPAMASSFIKSGPAELAYIGAGSNALTGASSSGYLVQNGSVRFDGGSSSSQVNLVQGNLGLGGISGVNTAMLLTNTSLIVGSQLEVGNSNNATATLVINSNANLSILGNPFALADSGGITACTGVVFQTAGTVNSSAELWVGQGANGMGLYTLSGGTLNLHNWLALGRTTSTGTFNMTGGTFNKDGNGNFLVATGNGSKGTFNQSGGTINSSSPMQIPENGNSTTLGTFNMSGSSVINDSSFLTVGRGGGVGMFNMTNGTINLTGSGNHLRIGTGGGSVGIFNQSGGTLNLSAGVEYWVAENNNCIGTNNISGTAVINCPTYVTVGRAGLGVVNMSGGTFTQTGGNPFFIGIFGGGHGIWNQSGGTLNVSAIMHIGDTDQGEFNLDNGSAVVSNQIWIAQGGGAVGTLTINGGTLTNTSWLAVGREDGHGTLNINGGIMVKTGDGNISIAHGIGDQTVIPAGTVNQTGGTFICATGTNWIGEDSGPGVWNMSGGLAQMGVVHLAEHASATGVLNLNGGTFSATEVSTGDTGSTNRTLNFNGGTLAAAADNNNFLHDLSAANVLANGAIVDSASHTIAFNQALLGGTPDGGLIKNGNGTLYLNGANTYTNVTQVNAGALGGSGTIMGPVMVAAGASLSPGTASIGTLTINNTLNLASGSSASAKLSMDGSPASDMVVVSSVNYAGTLVVTKIGTSPLVAGSQFQLFNAASHTGNFANAGSVNILPAGTGTFDPATGKLTITSTGGVTINPVRVSGGNLVLTGNVGTPNGSYTLLTTTNVATPLSLWTTNVMGTADASGMFSNNIPINSTDPARFFNVRAP